MGSSLGQRSENKNKDLISNATWKKQLNLPAKGSCIVSKHNEIFLVSNKGIIYKYHYGIKNIWKRINSLGKIKHVKSWQLAINNK